MAETLTEEGVERLMRADVRNAPTIAHDLDGTSQAFQLELTVEGRQWSAQKISERPCGERPGRPCRDTEAVQPERHLLAVAGLFAAKLPQELFELIDNGLRAGQVDVRWRPTARCLLGLVL